MIQTRVIYTSISRCFRDQFRVYSSVNIPTISIDTIYDTNQQHALIQAFQEYGCCYLKGHTITPNLTSSTFSTAKTFFQLPENIKNSIPIINNGQGFTRGYIGIGKESGSSLYVESKEAFSYGFEWPRHISTFHNALQGHNVWPKESVNNPWSIQDQKVLNEFYNAMKTTAQKLVTQLSEAYYQDRNFLLHYCTQGDTISIMRMVRYLPYKEYREEIPTGMSCIGSSPHTDWGFLTLILQDQRGGLQIYHKNKWIDVPYQQDTIVVNAGDYLSLLTNGKCMSPIHRVIHTTSQDRYSFVYFFYPNFDARIPPMNQIKHNIGGHEIERKDIKSFNHLLDETVGDIKGGFGEYIMAKWNAVQR